MDYKQACRNQQKQKFSRLKESILSKCKDKTKVTDELYLKC